MVGGMWMRQTRCTMTALGSYREVEVLSVQLLNHWDKFVWRLSEPCVQVLELGKVKQRSEVRLPPLSCYKNWEGSKRGENSL